MIPDIIVGTCANKEGGQQCLPSLSTRFKEWVEATRFFQSLMIGTATLNRQGIPKDTLYQIKDTEGHSFEFTINLGTIISKAEHLPVEVLVWFYDHSPFK